MLSYAAKYVQNIFQIPCNCQQLCDCQFILYGESIETSNADLGCLSPIPDPDFFHPGSWVQQKGGEKTLTRNSLQFSFT